MLHMNDKEESRNQRQAASKVTLDPEQMVQLMTNEQRLSETIPKVLNSAANPENFQSRPGAQHIVRLDSEQLDLLMRHQQRNTDQGSRIFTRPSAPCLKIKVQVRKCLLHLTKL